MMAAAVTSFCETTVMTQGARIKEARKARKLTQSDLAKRMGVESLQVSRWERDISTPRDIAALAEELRCDAGWLLTGDDPDAPPDKGEKISPPAYHEFVERFGDLFDKDVVELLEGPAHNRMGPFGEPTAMEYYELAKLWQSRKNR